MLSHFVVKMIYSQRTELSTNIHEAPIIHITHDLKNMCRTIFSPNVV